MGIFFKFGKQFPIMATMDVRARIRKTGEERIYPEKVFENICDEIDNPLDFIEYVNLPTEGIPQIQNQPAPEIHSQALIDEVIRLRLENQKLQELITEPEETETDPEKTKRAYNKKPKA